ncbi:hypothetical protein BBJ28_00024084 [Nothophytophthora sp. Chile5]|nr:hypothetical protein BBJ28_00024084 [Nothophytophthora sp. Chile5]
MRLDKLHASSQEAAVHKMNELVKRARLAKVHACLLGHPRDNIPTVFGMDKKQRELLDNMGENLCEVQRKYYLLPGDFPPFDAFVRQCGERKFATFASFPSRKTRELQDPSRRRRASHNTTQQALRAIWDLADASNAGSLDADQFAMATYLCAPRQGWRAGACDAPRRDGAAVAGKDASPDIVRALVRPFPHLPSARSEPSPKKQRLHKMARAAEEEKEAMVQTATWREEKKLLPPVPLVYRYNGGPSFYVRKCYDEYYLIVEELLLVENEECVTVTGTPGIGKSLFYAYFCARFLKTHADTWIIASSFVNEKVRGVAVFKGDEEPVREATDELIKALILSTVQSAKTAKKKVLFLCDGPPTRPRDDGQMVVFTSPNEKWLKISKKRYCDFYMPLWTREELHEAALVLALDIDGDEIDRRFEIFGGVARECLLFHQADVDNATEYIQGAIGAITKQDELQHLLLGKADSAIRHYLLHYEPRPIRKRKTVKLASPFVEQKLAERMSVMTFEQRESLRKLLRGVPEAASLHEWFFEVESHDALRQGRQLRARLLPVSEATAVNDSTGPQEERLDIARTDTTDEFTNKSLSRSLVALGPYHKPKSKTWESIDAFYLPRKDVSAGQKVTVDEIVEWNRENRLLLFQTTVSETHDVNASGIMHVLRKLDLLQSVESDPSRVALVFVVPKDLVDSYVRQTIVTVTTAGTESIRAIEGIGDIAAGMLEQNYGIGTIDELQGAVERYDRGELAIHDGDRGLWTLALTSLKKHGPLSDPAYGNAMAKIPQYVCSWEE